MANNGTLVVYAGTYNTNKNDIDISTTNYAQLTSGLTIELRPLNANTNINIDNAINKFEFNIANGTLNIVSTGGAKIMLADPTVNLTAGNINLDAASSLIMADGTLITIKGSAKFTNAAPTKTNNVSLSYSGDGSFTAGQESNYGDYGTGTIVVNKTAGSKVTFPNTISKVASITLTLGDADFNADVTSTSGVTIDAGVHNFSGTLKLGNTLAVNNGTSNFNNISLTADVDNAIYAKNDRSYYR